MREVSIVHRCGLLYIQRGLEYKGACGCDYGILIFLAECDTVNQEGIAAHFGLDKTTVAKAMDRLEKGNYIQRTSDEKDRRVKNAALTAEGLRAAAKIREVSARWHECVLENFTAEEKTLFEALLKKAAGAAWKCIHN